MEVLTPLNTTLLDRSLSAKGSNLLLPEIYGGGFFLKKCGPQGIVTRLNPGAAKELCGVCTGP